MQPEARKQRDDHVAEGRGRQHKGEIGPRKRSEIAGKEADQQRDAGGDPGREDGGDQRARMASEIAGIAVMPRERQVSPSGAQTATRPRIRYWRGER